MDSSNSVCSPSSIHIARSDPFGEHHECIQTLMTTQLPLQMASSPNTKSTSTTETVRGEYRFDFAGYSHKQGAGAGNALTSGTFAVGGFDWAIRYYPNDGKDDAEAFVSVFVRLVTPDATAWALFDLRLVDRATGLPRSVVCRSREPVAFGAGRAKRRERGARAFMARAELEASPYPAGDRLTVECVLDVVRETRLSSTTACPAIRDPPPPDLWEHLGALLMRTQVGADVTFAVQGVAFRAHRAVLAARSTVFKAELSGGSPPAKEDDAGEKEIVAIDGMTAPVFKTLLHFIYTDALPDLDDLGVEEHQELMRNLLSAAERYAMHRLKQICRVVVENVLDAKTVAATLYSTGQRHHCRALGDGCVQFMPSTG